MAFGNKRTASDNLSSGHLADFAYLSDKDIYLDTACQSLRPQPVIDALNEYYHTYNACGERVKYQWGQKVDEVVASARQSVLDLLKLSNKDYVTSFTLNTTYGINLILQQLPAGKFKRIITSDIEHNSVFLPTMTAAKRLDIPRLVLKRADDGSLDYQPVDLDGAVVVLNVVSNIDGRTLNNIKDVVADTHKHGGIVIIDAAQAMAHQHQLLVGSQPDAICFSAHKMYSASLGGIVISKDLLASLETAFVGGGMVSGVKETTFALIPDEPETKLEPGLQAWGEIVALNAAIKWLNDIKPNGQDRHEYIADRSQQLFDGLQTLKGVTLINQSVAPVISLYSDKYDAHRLALFLSAAGIMVRSGYFCCHYYLIEQRQLPPLVRFSLGLQTTPADIDKTIQTLQKLIGKA